jgi:F-type H+-transporting ATPase subunit a
VPKRRGCLGCSFPIIIGVLVVFLALFIISLISGALGSSFFGDLGLPSWLTVPRPHPELPAEVVFTLFGFPITNSIVAAWITIVVLVGISYAVTHRIKLIPSRLQCLLEFAIEWMLNLCKDVAGEKNGRRFFPIVTTIFLFVLMNAWLSLLPGFGSVFITNAEHGTVHLLRGANTDINMPLALALISFVVVEYWGLRSRGGLRYLSKFVNVSQFFRSLGQLFRGKLKAGLIGIFYGFINIFVGFLEAMSELVRIVSFTFRLFGNMTAGEILILMMLFLVPWILAIPFYGLELLVGFVQALIFGGLTLGFATLAVASHEADAV